MYVLTNAMDTVIYFTPTAERVENGISVDRGTMIFGEPGAKFFEIAEKPEGVKSFKDCYTVERGFFPNPDYVEPPAPVTAVVIAELQTENVLLKAQIKAQSDRADFMDDCIAEMAAQVYNV